jgi:hypothetical protein
VPGSLHAVQEALTALATTLRTRSYPVVWGHSATQLNLRFRLSEGLPLDALTGTLEFDAYTLHTARLASQLAIPVEGKIQPLGDVRFDPSTVVIHVVQWCWLISCNTKHGGSVHLYGSGIPPLLATVTPQSRALGVAVRNGGAVSLQLSHIERDPVQPDAATARVDLTSAPSSGGYAGVLPLSRLLADSPSLTIEVHSQKSVIWAWLCVFLGVLAAGLAFQRIPRQRRKRLMRRALTDASRKLLTECGNMPPELRETRVVGEMKRNGDVGKQSDWTIYTTLDDNNPANILEHIRWARDDDDLNEAEGATANFGQRCRRWLQCLKRLLVLHELETERNWYFTWYDTTVVTDTRRLVGQVLRASVTELDTSDLVEQLKRQAEWYRRFAEAWELRRRLAWAGGGVAAAAKRMPVDQLDANAERFSEKPPFTRSKLESELSELEDELTALQKESEKNPASSEVDRFALPQSKTETQAEDIALESDSLERILADDPTLGVTLMTAPDKVELDPRPVAAPAAGDHVASEPDVKPPIGPSISLRLGQRTARSFQVIMRYFSRGHIWRSRQLAWLRLTDIMVSGAILLVSSLVYTATFYNDDWGTFIDFVGAFGVGFLGEVTVEWGLLPIARSAILRLRPPAEAGQVPEAQTPL